jgi:tetratricopeptide (TPR) repeat protein
VASVVFKPEDGLLWVATGRAPVSNRDYAAFDLGCEGPRGDLAPLSAGRPPTEVSEAFDAYRDAYEAYFERGDLARARELMSRAVELGPNEAVYHFMAGVLALLARDASSSERSFERAIALGHVASERTTAFHLWRGRARDVLGRRTDALGDYRVARESSESSVRTAAKRGLRSRWRPRRFGVEFGFADVPMP